MCYYKVEGNIHYPNNDILTWGPYYYHSKEKAIEKIPIILNDITDWTNSIKDVSKNQKI